MNSSQTRWARRAGACRLPIERIDSRWIAPSTSVVSQQQPRQMRKSTVMRLSGLRDPGDPRRRERQHRVIHLFQKQAVQIDEIAGYMQGGELAPAAGQGDLERAARPLMISELFFPCCASSLTISWPAVKSISRDGAPRMTSTLFSGQRVTQLERLKQGVRHGVPPAKRAPEIGTDARSCAQHIAGGDAVNA